MISIGVTGGIGSGKSAVCDRLLGRGARIFNADTAAQELMVHDPEVREGVRRVLGQEAYHSDGSLNKPLISERIFGREEDRKALEAVVHPAVGRRFEQAKRDAERDGVSLLVKEQAVFPTAEARAQVDIWIAVEAPVRARLARVARRAGQDPDQARARIQAQPDDATYRSIADHVIVNDGTIEDLHASVDRVLEDILRCAGPATPAPENGT